MAEAPHRYSGESGEEEDGAPSNTLGEGEEAGASSNALGEEGPPDYLDEREEEGLAFVWGVIRDSWELLRNDLRARKQFVFALSAFLLCNIIFGPHLLTSPFSSREQIIETYPKTYVCMIIGHLLFLVYGIYLQFCVSHPVIMGCTRASQTQVLESSSESTSTESESESGETIPMDPEQVYKYDPDVHTRGAEKFAQVFANPANFEAAISQSVRPRTRSRTRMSRERERTESTRMPPTERVGTESVSMQPPFERSVLAEISMSPEGVIYVHDLRGSVAEFDAIDLTEIEPSMVQLIRRRPRTRSQSRREAESSKPRRRHPPKGS